MNTTHNHPAACLPSPTFHLRCLFGLMLGAALAPAARAAGESADWVRGIAAVDSVLAQALKPGLDTVDPYALNQPAVSDLLPWFGPVPYDQCWRTQSGYTCVLATLPFQVGDGSLAGQGGNPYDLGIACDGGFTLYGDFRRTWTVARYYDRNGDLVSRLLHEQDEGRIYNAQTGKAADYSTNDVWRSDFSVPGGDLTYETFQIASRGGATASTLEGKPLAFTHGSLVVREDGSFAFGPGADFPFARYYLLGDYSGVKPICDYLQ